MFAEIQALRLRDLQAGYDRFGVVGEAQAVDAVSRFQLTGCDQGRLIVTRHHLLVDSAFNLVAFHCHRDLLRDRFTDGGGFVHCRIGAAAWSIHLKRGWTKTAYDEVAVAVSRAVEVALLIGAEIVAGDYDAVGMRMVIETHVLRLFKGRCDGVVAGRFVRRVPIGHRWTSYDVQRVAFFGEFCAVQSQSGGLFFGVDLSGPTGNGDSTAGDAA